MSVIGGLLMPQFKPYDLGGTLEQANRIAGGVTNNQTALLTLADLKAKQASEQEYLLAIKNNPEIAKLILGGSTIGSLPTTGGPPAPGPLTQQTTMPGQPAGAPTVVPGGQDLSRFANVSPQGGGPIPPDVMAQTRPTVTPPPGPQGVPTLATLGAQPQGPGPMQGPMQGPQNPLVEMARRDPRAAMMLQQQMQAQEDMHLKRQEQRLKMSTTILDSLGRRAQGATDQASWDLFRQDAAAIDPRMAAQLPQVYSKEAKERVVAQALDVKEAMTLQVQDLTAQAAVMKARREQANIPNYTGDAQLDAIIYTKMKGQPAGTIPGEDIVQDAIRQREADKLRVSREQGREHGVSAAEIERIEKPLEGAAAKSVSDLTLLRTMADDIAALRHDDFTGPVVGRTGYVREQAGQMKEQETAFRRTVKDVQDILGRLRSGAAIPAPEMSRLEGLAPSVNDPPAVFQSKLQSFQRALEQNRESILRTSTTGRGQLRAETTPTTPRVGEPPTSQGTTRKPVGQMTAEETRAEIAAIKARGGR